MLKPDSLVSELRLRKIKQLDEGPTGMNEKEEANVAWSVSRSRGCDRPHSASVQMVLDFSISHISKLAEKPNVLAAAAMMLSGMAGEVIQNKTNRPGNASSWERSNVPAKLTEAQMELIADIFNTGIYRQVK